MTRPSRQRERIAQIIALLDVTPALHLRDLADQIGVAEMTLRRDAARADSGFSCRGGYVVRDRSTEHYDFDTQMSRAIEAKRRACEVALEQVADGAVVFLDTGTTLPHLHEPALEMIAVGIGETRSLENTLKDIKGLSNRKNDKNIA